MGRCPSILPPVDRLAPDFGSYRLGSPRARRDGAVRRRPPDRDCRIGPDLVASRPAPRRGGGRTPAGPIDVEGGEVRAWNATPPRPGSWGIWTTPGSPPWP